MSFVPYLCFMVCVCGVGGCHCNEATGNTLTNGLVHIPEPQPRNHLSLALHCACLNVAMCTCTRKIVAHKMNVVVNLCMCMCVCVDVCMGVYVCTRLDICVP